MDTGKMCIRDRAVAGHAVSLTLKDLDQRGVLCQINGLTESARKADDVAHIRYKYGRIRPSEMRLAAALAVACGSDEFMVNRSVVLEGDFAVFPPGITPIHPPGADVFMGKKSGSNRGIGLTGMNLVADVGPKKDRSRSCAG